MQNSTTIAGLAVIAALALSQPTQAQTGVQTISPIELDRVGLEKMWSGRVPVDPTRSKIAHFRQVVTLKDPLIVFQVDHDGQTKEFSSNDLNVIGEPMGEAGAKAKAEQYAAQRDTRKGEPELTRKEVPSSLFLFQSNSGIVAAMDGRTGRKLWTQVYGHPNEPHGRPDANNDYVVTVNGFTLRCLHRINGEEKWSVKVTGMPTAGPRIGEKKVYLPMLDGSMAIFDMSGERGLVPKIQSLGNIYSPAIATKNAVAWATDDHRFYVAAADEPTLRYRIQSRGNIVAPPSNFGQAHFFYATETGYVTCVYASDGEIPWRFSCGKPIQHAPAAAGNFVYVTLRHGGMYQLALTSGEAQWFVPGVKQYLAANNKYIYALSEDQRIMVLDITSGSMVGSFSVRGYDFFYTNHETDRIIMGTQDGLVMVLRSRDLPYPIVHVDVDKPAEVPDPADFQGSEDAEGTEPKAPSRNPFGDDAVADPFATKPAAPATDPFATPAASDPFATPDSSPASDPFATPDTSNDNPFGN